MAIENWKRAIELAVELECPMFVSEFGRGGSPNRSLNDTSGLHRPEVCEGQFFRAMDILVPLLEKEGIKLSLEAHPEDWVEEVHPAIDIIKTINSPMVRASFIAPHTFFYGPNMEQTCAQQPVCWNMFVWRTPMITTSHLSCATL